MTEVFTIDPYRASEISESRFALIIRAIVEFSSRHASHLDADVYVDDKIIDEFSYILENDRQSYIDGMYKKIESHTEPYSRTYFNINMYRSDMSLVLRMIDGDVESIYLSEEEFLDLKLELERLGAPGDPIFKKDSLMLHDVVEVIHGYPIKITRAVSPAQYDDIQRDQTSEIEPASLDFMVSELQIVLRKLTDIVETISVILSQKEGSEAATASVTLRLLRIVSDYAKYELEQSASESRGEYLRVADKLIHSLLETTRK